MENIGVLFDWDGVIIDSSRQHEESWERLATEERRALPADHVVPALGYAVLEKPKRRRAEFASAPPDVLRQLADSGVTVTEAPGSAATRFTRRVPSSGAKQTTMSPRAGSLQRARRAVVNGTRRS